MRHEKYEELIVLSLYDELEKEEKKLLEEHLPSCPQCSRFLAKLSGTFGDWKEKRGPVDEQMLNQARRELRVSLSNEKREAGRMNVYVGFPKLRRWGFAPVPVYAAVAFAVVMLAAGLLSGLFLFNRSSGSAGGVHTVLSEISAANSRDVAIADVRFLPGDKNNGDLRFSFNLVRRYVMDGSLDDKDVQKVLAFALVNSDNPGVRLRTIGMLDASVKPDPEIERALVKAVETDENAGVRREALLSLEKFPFNNTIKEALLFVLQKDKNPGMRVAAINILAGKELSAASGAAVEKRVDPRVLEVLRERSASDQNRYVRLKAADMLKEFKEL